jgi:hypothetical protein
MIKHVIPSCSCMINLLFGCIRCRHMVFRDYVQVDNGLGIMSNG